MLTRTVIDEKLILTCVREAKQAELAAKENESNNNNSNHHHLTSTQDKNNSSNHNNNNNNTRTNSELAALQINELSQIQNLDLSFRNIFQIDHLRGYENLIKLQLDNNLLTTIENLDHLTNLQWLDLSFNNITKIENLEGLRNLTDLCLVNNFITKIENLHSNTKLQVLSIANNCLTAANPDSIEDDFRYLRQLKNLQALNIAGNPICAKKTQNKKAHNKIPNQSQNKENHNRNGSDSDNSETDSDDSDSEDNENSFREFNANILAYCPQLKFLNYERILDSDKLHAKMQKAHQLTQLELSESEAQSKQKQELKHTKYIALLKSCNINSAYTLFEDLIRDDSEYNRLKQLPKFAPQIENYQILIRSEIQTYVEKILNLYNTKMQEQEMVNQTIQAITLKSETESIQIITEYFDNSSKNNSSNSNKHKNKNGAKSEPEAESEAVVASTTVMQISDALMENEIDCSEQIKHIINVYEDRITELMRLNLNCAEMTFASVMNFENDYHHKLLKIHAQSVQQIEQNGIDSVIEALPENESIRNMMLEKDAVKNSLHLSHENHISFIGRLEDSIREKEEKEKNVKMELINKAEYSRNRQRVSQILIFVEKET